MSYSSLLIRRTLLREPYFVTPRCLQWRTDPPRFQHSAVRPKHPNPIPATFLRGGTSKGVFIKRAHLPPSQDDWKPIFLGIMGSPDPSGRQLDGMGGGISSLSKICVVAPATPEQQEKHNIDVQYTFVQVGIKDDTIDVSGNCGNLTSMIAAFALDEKMCPVRRHEDGTARVRCFNTNTEKIIDITLPVSERGIPILDKPETSIAGVPNLASQIVCEYLDPAGARTGKLLPTSRPLDEIPIHDIAGNSVAFPASLVDATNPSVFIHSDELRKLNLDIDRFVAGKESDGGPVSKTLEEIRQQGARSMNLSPTAQAQPKIAILSAPSAEDDLKNKADIIVHALSMGVLHKAIPMTLGLCLGVAAKVEGTVACKIIQDVRKESGSTNDLIRIRHPGGIVDVGAEFAADGKVKSAKVVRTGRRLMKGVVWW